MSDTTDAAGLVQALEKHLGPLAGLCTRCHPWRSATYSGIRHELGVAEQKLESKITAAKPHLNGPEAAIFNNQCGYSYAIKVFARMRP